MSFVDDIERMNFEAECAIGEEALKELEELENDKGEENDNEKICE